jgi:hypothetical protein
MKKLIGKWFEDKRRPDKKVRFVYGTRDFINEILYADTVAFTISGQGAIWSEMEEVTIIEQEKIEHYLGTEMRDFGYNAFFRVALKTIFGEGWNGND